MRGRITFTPPSAVAAAGFNVTIQVADGSYAEGVILPNVIGFATMGNLVIRGNNITPSNVLVNANSANVFTADTVAAVWDILDMKVQASVSGAALLAVRSKLRFGNLNFGACANSHINAQQHGNVLALSNYAISGGAGDAHLQTSDTGLINVGTKTITFSGTVANGNFALATMAGLIYVYGMTFTNGGIVTGPRYFSATNGIILTNGGGANYLPGSIAGGTATQGQYV
jgi:hypothetical protein